MRRTLPSRIPALVRHRASRDHLVVPLTVSRQRMLDWVPVDPPFAGKLVVDAVGLVGGDVHLLRIG